MLRPILTFLISGWLLTGATVVDRVAVIVGKNVVKSSDIVRDLRASQFVNQEPVNMSADAARKSADRLVDQQLIRQEIANGGYSQPSDEDVTSFFDQLRRDRFGGSDARLRSALSTYGLSESDLRTYLRFQLTVLRFIDERFRPGVLVTDEDISGYYNQHRAELQKAYPKDSSLQTLTPKIRETLIGERVNQSFEEWLNQTRSRTRVEYREAAIREGVSP